MITARKTLGAVLSVLLLSLPLVACTPRPLDPVPVVEDFFAAVNEADFEAAASHTDQRTISASSLEASYNGLQAEGVEVHVGEVNTADAISKVHYTLDWQLPGDRVYSYDANMVLHQVNNAWQVQWQPQVVHPKLTANQHLELRAVQATKASVQSSDGVPLLTPGSVYRVYIDASDMNEASAAATANRLASGFETLRSLNAQTQALDADSLAKSLAEATGLYSVGVIPSSLGAEAEAELGNIQGVSLQEEAAMVNERPNFATDLLRGVADIAADELEGANGWSVQAVTAEGVSMQTLFTEDAAVAPTVTVSVDYQVQEAAEQAVNLRNDMQTMIVAIRPNTGDILAVAQTEPADAEGDIALSGLYPPGSTFKTITAAAGIERAGYTPGSTVACPGTMNIQGRTVTNYNGFSLGNVSLTSAFAHSCNTTFAQISTDLKPGELQSVAAQFGIGREYKIPGINNVTGSVPTGEEAIDRTEAGYGQGDVLVSPFSMALAAATVANGGVTPTPTLIRGQETESDEAPAPLDATTIEQMRTLMSAVNGPDGTASSITADGNFFTKTGEAEIADASHAWFMGFREFEGETIAFATLMPRGGGSEVAVSITDSFFNFLDSANSENAD
ncbi:MAG: penicillin-binding transpeptidase domain-containing protein [Corynebacterium sp.]|nr:penicillin-binding transpeptidase domain-containing protein [Corynebacterium sp.]